MEAILELPPIPIHDAARMEPVRSAVLAAWPEGTFIENLAVLPDGSVAVSVLSELRIDRVTKDGTIETLVQLEAPPTGLVVSGNRLIAAVGFPGEGEGALWVIDIATRTADKLMTISGSRFINGLTPFDSQHLIATDSHLGRLFLLNPKTGISDTWFEHELLTRAPGVDALPGANGVKRFGDQCYVASNGRALLVGIAVDLDGGAGSMEVIAERLRVDDFAIDQSGNLFLATHIGGTIDRLSPNGTRVTLAGPEHGCAGSTAAAFRGNSLLVTTTGGIILPTDGKLQPARLLELNVEAVGHPLGEVDQ